MVNEEFCLREGLGEAAAFYRSHPLLNFIYFALVIGVTMFATHPVFLAASFVMSWVYSVLLRGRRGLIMNLLIMVPTVVLMIFFNTLNVHNGVTVLFYLNDNRITMEAIIFGLAMAIMLCSIINWFGCFSVVVTADKFIYLFGRVAPVLALTLSMTMRYIPLLKNRFKELSAAQRCMGRGLKTDTLWNRIKQFGKEMSILIAWSLEASIEGADSMEARGYGLKGRSSFHLFRLAGREKQLLVLMLLLGGVVLAACLGGDMTIYYYPRVILPEMTLWQSVALAAYLGLMSIPILVDLRGMYEWKLYHAEM